MTRRCLAGTLACALVLAGATRALAAGESAGTAAASFLSVSPSNVVVPAVKKAEEGDDLIVRLVETEGRPGEVALDLPLVKRQWKGAIGASQIKTLRIPRRGGAMVPGCPRREGAVAWATALFMNTSDR